MRTLLSQARFPNLTASWLYLYFTEREDGDSEMLHHSDKETQVYTDTERRSSPPPLTRSLPVASGQRLSGRRGPRVPFPDLTAAFWRFPGSPGPQPVSASFTAKRLRRKQCSCFCSVMCKCSHLVNPAFSRSAGHLSGSVFPLPPCPRRPPCRVWG